MFVGFDVAFYSENLDRNIDPLEFMGSSAFEQKSFFRFFGCSTETIWDHNPTEQEIVKICEERKLSQQEIMMESRKSENRLLCLIALFELRKNRKEVERIWQEHDILFPMIL